ncbi:hypothetical protein CVT24_002125 [Panaeolus cyanescens]|uniref:Uncharacterized protein n=1 Tax=Panaeolus cyanescens TaxID=181874 RepID=A0A409YI30_9AGAR|nr:hypothetical protein CVT24_002125 [Panaeolus cyanescens]
MASVSSSKENVAYACKCLNVRITPSTPPSDPPDYPRNDDYVPVFVGNDGISVVHPQVTVRISTRGEAISGTSRCSRFTALTCLFCDLSIYRVHQVISTEVDLKDSVLFPTEEWVEHDVMKSPNGWIDVHKAALSAEEFSQAQSSPNFATIFSLLLPSTSTSPSSPRKTFAKDDVQFKPPKESHEEPTTPSYLSDMVPLYLPPPFTPSHPVFALLADIADKESKRIRSEAEQRIANFIKTEIAGIEAMENGLRSQVEALWKNFRGHLGEVQEINQRNTTARSPVRGGGERFSTNGVVSPARLSSSVTVRSFVPVSVPTASHPSTVSSVPRVSALSASLATSNFHHPRHSRSKSPSTSRARVSADSSSSRTLSSTPSGSSTLVQGPQYPEGLTVMNIKRNVDDNLNTQASYRYFVNIEEERARHQREQEEALKAQGTAMTQHNQSGPSNPISSSVSRKMKKTQTPAHGSSLEGKAAAENDGIPTRGRDKGKRKVTFDVEPAVVTIQTNADKASGEGEATVPVEDPREMIFPMEDLENNANGDVVDQGTAMSLPLVEQPPARPPRPRKLRSPNTTALLESFASLRPSSLPNPSYIRPMRSSPGVDSSQAIVLPRSSLLPPSAEASQATSKASSTVPSPTTMSERDMELRKLVAADTPSHRGAWTPDSKAWQMFARRQSSKEEVDQSDSAGESESGESGRINIAKRGLPRRIGHDDDENHFDGEESSRMMSGSLPVHINRIKPREPLSLASYKPPNTITEEVQDAVISAPALAQKHLSSAAIRKATYLERDRSRSMDPGTLDFPSEGEDDGSDSDSDVVESETLESGERARKKALKILQARSELPEEGMWRSLANDAPVL